MARSQNSSMTLIHGEEN